MKKLLTLAIILFITFVVSASDKEVPFYYVNKKGDTIKCTILLHIGLLANEPSDIDGDNKVKIVTLDHKKITLLADTVKAIGFTDTKERKFVSLMNTFGFPQNKGQYIFMEHLLNDYYKLFAGHYTYTVSYGPGRFSSVNDSYFFYQRNDSLLIHIESKSAKFKEQLCSLLYDNPVLVNKIRSNEYKFENTSEILNNYNIWKRSNPKQSDDTTVYYSVNPPPLFDGREIEDLNFYFKSRMKWPRQAYDEKLIIQGIVEKDGSFSSIMIRGFKKLPEIKNNFLEIAKTMKRWTPAVVDGAVVRSYVAFIIKY